VITDLATAPGPDFIVGIGASGFIALTIEGPTGPLAHPAVSYNLYHFHPIVLLNTIYRSTDG
jgi:hypothetical protein